MLKQPWNTRLPPYWDKQGDDGSDGPTTKSLTDDSLFNFTLARRH